MTKKSLIYIVPYIVSTLLSLLFIINEWLLVKIGVELSEYGYAYITFLSLFIAVTCALTYIIRVTKKTKKRSFIFLILLVLQCIITIIGFYSYALGGFWSQSTISCDDRNLTSYSKSDYIGGGESYILIDGEKFQFGEYSKQVEELYLDNSFDENGNYIEGSQPRGCYTEIEKID